MDELRTHLGAGRDQGGIDTVGELVSKAEQALFALRELVKSANAIFLPIGSITRYLLVLLEILKMRDLDAAAARAPLRSALGRLDNVIVHFDDAAFLRFSYEAKLIRDSIKSAVQPPEH
jgi:hypothetical protein